MVWGQILDTNVHQDTIRKLSSTAFYWCHKKWWFHCEMIQYKFYKVQNSTGNNSFWLCPDYEFSQPFEFAKKKQYFKSEVSFVLPSLVDPLSWQDDGIKGQTNILSDPPFLVDHGNAIYLGIGCRLG